MRTSSVYRVVAIFFISILLLTSCKPATTEIPDTPTLASTQTPEESGGTAATAENTPTASAQEPTAQEPGAADTAPAAPTATPIVETRLPPEQWREWPVVPELTGREVAIYQHGLSLGNDPTHFSKVGDCQAIKEVLLGIYDLPDRYTLTENQGYLQETIDHFTGSFNRDGQAVRGGYNTAAVLSPVWADPEACQPGESPIACEYRLHKPSFVIISLEVWWEGRTVDRYVEYMRQIIEFYIDNGVVPILSTKADNVEGDHRINLATARLAYEYHIPMWNFWLAVQPLPNHGIDPDRDGFHISYEAWSVRSFTALQTLDAVWRGVREKETTAPETPAETPEAAVSFPPLALIPAPQPLPVPPEGEKLVFSITQRSGESYQSAGVFIYAPETTTLYQLFGPGYRLEDVSATGTDLLVSQGAQLFISDLNGETERITDRLAQTPREASAFWTPDGTRLLVMTAEEDGVTLSIVDWAADTWDVIASGEITGIIKPSAEDNAVYWYQGQCSPENVCETNTVWRSKAGLVESFAETDRIAIAENGETYAWAETTEEALIVLYTRSTSQTLQDYLYLPGNRLIDMAWGPFNNRLGLLTVTRSDYTGKSSDARIFVVDANTMSHLEYFAFPGLNASLNWSADGGELLLSSTLTTDEGYQLHFRQMNLTSGLFDILDENLMITSEGFMTINELHWIFP
jgi:hypothetical protein